MISLILPQYYIHIAAKYKRDYANKRQLVTTV